MKTSRQNLILELIAKNDIETQNQLMEALEAEGVSSTQATISRDIKALRLVKELSPDGKYRYVSAARDAAANVDARLRKIFRESVTSFAYAQNLVILKTLPGLASAACSALDGMALPHLVGTLAGDDTAFLAMKDTESAKEFCREIAAML